MFSTNEQFLYKIAFAISVHFYYHTQFLTKQLRIFNKNKKSFKLNFLQSLEVGRTKIKILKLKSL